MCAHTTNNDKTTTRHLPRGAPLLQVGVGTSGVQTEMVLRDGYAAITSLDYSPVCIARLEAARDAAPAPGGERLRAALRYAVADMRSMREAAPDGAFAGALDKGALDALLCGDDGEADAARAVDEIWRALRPGGGVYLMVTSAAPRARLPLLLRNGGGGGGGGGGDAAGGAPRRWRRVLVYEVGQQGRVVGPVDADADPAGAAAMPTLAYSHFAYVCVK